MSHALAPNERRSQILSAARQVFADQGYYRASVSDIVKAAGVARGTFYNYFDSKRAVFQAILDELMDAVNAAVVPIDILKPIPPQVGQNLDSLIAICTRPEVARILFTEATSIDDESDQALKAFYRQAIARITRALETGQQMGIVREGALDLTAQMLLGVLTQPVLIASLEGRTLDRVAFVDDFYALLAGGVLR
ncbi:MAG: AcrR family transcriptional regulator [Myxococcota bacterium]|jgi:AcrR family transcriptional regulator